MNRVTISPNKMCASSLEVLRQRANAVPTDVSRRQDPWHMWEPVAILQQCQS